MLKEVAMAKVIEPKATAMAEWYDIVREAEKLLGHEVGDELESYLVNLLLRFMDKPGLASAVLGLDYLLAEQHLSSTRYHALRKVGDQCLLYSGLFPERAERRRLRVSYFVELGQRSYFSAAAQAGREHELAELFQHLSNRFVRLMDILHSMRSLGIERQLSLLQAVELWQDTGSEFAYKIITQHTDGFVIKPR
jgi:hypothetical protein